MEDNLDENGEKISNEGGGSQELGNDSDYEQKARMMGEFDENYSGQDDYGCEETGSAQIKSTN